MEEKSRCLNCQVPTFGNYCANCGQKTDTHRITLKHFIVHDLVHGLWHLDRGILFTIKEAIVRPGKAALDYIAGKRIRYYNVFYLSLLLIAVNIIVWHLLDNMVYGERKTPRENSEFVDLMAQNVKALVFCIVPLVALNGRLIFSRLRLNFSEHCIIGGMSLLGILIMTIPTLCFMALEKVEPVFAFFKIFFVLVILPFYPAYVYRNATKGLYSSGGLIVRFLAMTFFLLLEVFIIVTAITILFVSDSEMKINI